MPILQEIPLDPTNITIPEQLQIELDRTTNINQIKNLRSVIIVMREVQKEEILKIQ